MFCRIQGSLFRMRLHAYRPFATSDSDGSIFITGLRALDPMCFQRLPRFSSHFRRIRIQCQDVKPLVITYLWAIPQKPFRCINLYNRFAGRSIPCGIIFNVYDLSIRYESALSDFTIQFSFPSYQALLPSKKAFPMDQILSTDREAPDQALLPAKKAFPDFITGQIGS